MLNFKGIKDAAKRSFSGALEILLPGICGQFGSNEHLQKSSTGMDISYINTNVLDVKKIIFLKRMER